MKVTITPCEPGGIINAPPSKSDAHRLLVCGGLCEGESVIDNVALSKDILATLGCLETMGARWEKTEKGIKIKGINPLKSKIEKELFCNECGTTIRFFIPLCLLCGDEVKVTGSSKLLTRPLSVYEEICKEQGIYFNNDGEKITLKGKLKPGEYKVKGNISSQFISGLLFALPLISGDSTLKIIPPFESKPYVDMTLSVLKTAGIEISKTDDLTFTVKGNQSYKPFNKRVEGDWSNGAFPAALSAMGYNVKTEGLDEKSLQGDKICIEHFRALNEGSPVIDLSDCPDLAPVLFAYAGMHKGADFTGTARLKIKESDRIGEMGEELSKFGIILEETEKGVKVHGGVFNKPLEELKGHNDHRIVMTLALMLIKTGGTVDGIEAVNKSYPDFFKDLESLGVKMTYGT